jgi:WD40 repeat protein
MNKTQDGATKMLARAGEGLVEAIEGLEGVAVGDQRRLLALAGLVARRGEGEPAAERARCVAEICGGVENPEAAFRTFMSRVNKAAAGALVIEPRREEGVIVFLTPDDTEERVAEYSRRASELPPDEEMIDTPAIAGDPLGRPQLSYVVIYSDGDTKEATALIEELRPHLTASSRYAHDLWDQRKILNGQTIAADVEQALERAHYVIAMVSPRFLSDPLLAEIRQRLPGLPCIPVMLGLIDRRQDVTAIAGKKTYGGERGSWSQSERKGEKERFVLGLFQEIEAVVDHGRAGQGALHKILHDQARLAARLESGLVPVDGEATSTDLRDVVGDAARVVKPQSGLKMLVEWVMREDARHYACVLGEFGIGKTTLLKRFTHALLDLRERGEAAPLPIYVDLRVHVAAIEGVREGAQVPELSELLGELLRRTWTCEGRAPEVAQVLRMVREQGAVILIDGLDEKLVHMTEAQGAALIRTLWGILPPGLARSRERGRRPGRIVLSCRSHLFPTLQRQNAAFAGSHRDAVGADQYLGLIVLPFSEEKIKEYLALNFGAQAEGALRLIQTVHNLSDLAQRPVFLNLIRGQIGALEAMAARGEVVRGVSLYDHLVKACQDRDEGKHTISREDKLVLMEALAAAMWRDGAREWPWERVFRWLREEIVGDPVLLAAYPLRGEGGEKVAEDFRTATMVLRPDQSDGFRFAHTSLHEYFLARWLFRGLMKERADAWQVPMPSDETLDFFGQIVALRPAVGWQGPFVRILEVHRPLASRAALRYWLLAQVKGYAAPQPRRVCVPGEDLEGWRFVGAEGGWLDLRGADLQKTRLRGALWARVLLDGADLRGVDAVNASFEGVRARGVRLEGADLTGTVWRDCELEAETDEGTGWWDSEWVRTPLPLPATSRLAAKDLPRLAELGIEIRGGHAGWVRGCAWSPDGCSIVSASTDNSLRVWDAASGRCNLTLQGHSGPVLGCAWSPDGRSIVSASFDGTMRVWVAASGRCNLTLQGHSGPVLGCAWSPDGRSIVSASTDNSLRVWDAVSSRCNLTLQGHSRAVNGCAWSPDGRSIVSASRDNSLRVWDAASGRCNLTLQGHSGPVLGCAWSPDGRSIVSASDDKSLRVWDAASGRCNLTLQGHSGTVWGCAWSPDGRSIVSASLDNSLRVWDATSGRCNLTLQGHLGTVWGCAWSPDGRSIVSASRDNSLRVWDAASGRCNLTLQGHSGPVLGCAWSPDGRSIVSASRDNSLRVWDAASRCNLTLLGHSGAVWGCAWSPDGRSIVSASTDNSLRVWDAASGRCNLTLLGHSRAVSGCAWSPDGCSIVSTSEDNSLRVWDAASGRCNLTLQGHSGPVLGCAWSPDGRSIVSASTDNSLRVWDAAFGRCNLTLQGHSRAVNGCAWSPDGRSIVSASDDKSLRVWDAASGRCNLTLQGHLGTVWGCAWSPDGRSIVSASRDNSLRVWDAASGRCNLTLQGHSSPVWGCAWSPDGRSIVSASSDGTMRVWDAASGECEAVYWHHSSEAACLDLRAQRVRWASPGAWRSLCYRAFDPERGAFRIYPVEAAGVLGGGKSRVA